jgi:flavin-dependent dehydrogenase
VSGSHSESIDDTRCDVLVIGGGPGGSTIGALLAERGWRVTLLEKDRHPRFHIGESLLPMNLPLFERLGVEKDIARIGIIKHGAEFNSAAHGRALTFDFANALESSIPYAYEVRRSEFDHVLLQNCAAKGARVHEGTRVTSVEFPATGDVVVTARTEDNRETQWRARFLVDASGRDTFLANRLGVKRKNPRHASAALFGHFTGARRLPGREEGNISVFWFPHGWFWFIPLLDGTTSVGAVCWPYYLKSRRTDPTTFLHETIALCPELAARLANASLTGPATATGNYSYEAECMAGDRFIMVGDAYAFVDPVFSSGVYLAMSSAFGGADVVDGCLRDPAAARRLSRKFERRVRRGLRLFSWMIYRMTSPAIRELIMNPKNIFGVESAMISFLAGDVFRRGAVYRRLLLFRVLYYANNLAAVRTNARAWWRRRQAIRATESA